MNTYPIICKLISEKQAFLDDLRPKYISPSLKKHNVITSKEEKEIFSEALPTDQVEKLFSILTKKSSQDLNNFIRALNEDEDGCSTYPWLAKLLETTNNLDDEVYKILVNGNIPFPVNHLLDRSDKLECIRDSLQHASDAKRHWVVLFGPIGSGKSILAAESVRNNIIVQNFFPDGIYWLQIGQLNDEEAIRFKLKKMFKLLDYKSELPPNESLSDLTHTLKKEICKNPKILVILDDVWCTKIIKAFDIGCPILVTTKNKKALEKVSSYCSLIECNNDLKPKEISLLLSMYVKCDPEQLSEVVDEICIKCKGSPLISSLIGSMMSDVGNNSKKWKDLNNRLEERGTDTIRRRWCSGDHSNDLNKIINLCLEPIKHLRNYYLDFLIFVKDFPVPNELLEILWEKEDYEVLEIMVELNSRCFIQIEKSEEDNERYSYTSHDLYLDALKAEINAPELENRHKILVEKILQKSMQPDKSCDLTKLPKSYIPYTIGYHLYHAKRDDLLEHLYLDLNFIEQKIHLTEDVMDILFDYQLYRKSFKNEEHVEMFESFIRRNAVAISQKSDIVQLALFESSDSIVYEKAKELARKSNNGKYFDWCNKEDSIHHLYSYTTKYASEDLRHAAFNANGSSVASVGENLAWIRSSSTGEAMQELSGHSDVVNFCAFNSNGDRLVTASADKTVKIFRVEDSLTSSGDYSKKRFSVPTLNSAVDKKVDKSILTFTEHEHEVVCCAYSPDDSYIISSDKTGVTYVWAICGESENPHWIVKHKKHHSFSTPCFRYCCFSNYGRMFGTAVYDTIKLWDFETGELKATFPHNGYLVEKFCFTRDDSCVFSVSDNKVSKWNVRSENERSIVYSGCNNSFVIYSCCLSPNDKYIACGTTKPSVLIINVVSGVVVRNLRGHNDFVINVMYSNDNKKLLSVSSSKYIIHDVKDIKDTHLISFDGNLSVHLGKELTVASSNSFNSVEVRKGFDGKLMSSSQPEEEDISACSLSNDLSEVVYGTKNGTLKVFNIATKNSVVLLEHHDGKVNYILHSKTDSTFFTCSEDKTVKVWKSYKDPLTLKGHTQSVLMCVAFKTDNKLLSCSKDGTIRIWDTISGKTLVPITEGHGNQDVRFCDISPQEDYIASASADETIKVWDASNGMIIKNFHYSEGDGNTCVRCCRFSPSNKTLISGHDNGKVILWHLVGNQGYTVLSASHDSTVYSINFTVDGSQFLSVSKSIKLWSQKNQLIHSVLLPSSYMGTDPPSVWTSDHFDVLVIILNSILYILKRIK